MAQTEREKIRERQRQGIEAAKARGVRFGRPRTELPEELFNEIVVRWSQGEFTAREAARQLGISRSTFFRRLREMRVTEEGSAAEHEAEESKTVHEIKDSGVDQEHTVAPTSAEAPRTSARRRRSSYAVKHKKGVSGNDCKAPATDRGTPADGSDDSGETG